MKLSKRLLLQNIRCFSRASQTWYIIKPRQYSTHEGYMSAWQIHNYGGLDQLKLSDTVEIPTVRRPWDVLVKVHAASINPIDYMMLGGYGAATMNAFRRLTCSFSKRSEFPLILGRDFSGVVIATGKAVPQSKYKPGDEVWGAGDPWRQGTFADYTVINALQMSPKPKSLNHIEAATLPYVGATSWAALCTFGLIQPRDMIGKRALVLGGSGGIGTFAIQLLKAWGAEVTTTCAGDAVIKVLELGADVALDYTKEDVFLELKQIQGFDVILDATGDNSAQCMPLLKKYSNARYITLTTPFLRNNDENIFPLGLIKTGITLGTHNIKALQDGQTYRWGLFMPNGFAMKQIADLVDSGKIQPVLEKVYPFSELPSAFEKVGAKHNRGKSVLDVAGEYVEQVEPHEEQKAEATGRT